MSNPMATFPTIPVVLDLTRAPDLTEDRLDEIIQTLWAAGLDPLTVHVRQSFVDGLPPDRDLSDDGHNYPFEAYATDFGTLHLGVR